MSPKTTCGTCTDCHDKASFVIAGLRNLATLSDSIFMSDSKLANNESFESVCRVIRERKTTKVLAKSNPVALPEQVCLKWDEVVRESLAAAGWAPFHYDRKRDGIAEPWRCYFLRTSACRSLAEKLSDLLGGLPPNNKLPKMLAACGALVIVTYLPESDFSDAEKGRQVNEEHLIAASAFTQSFLLALTAAGTATYWASGGLLGQVEVRRHLGIGLDEGIVAAAFVEYPNDGSPSDIERLPGKNRDVRSSRLAWTRELA